MNRAGQILQMSTIATILITFAAAAQNPKVYLSPAKKAFNRGEYYLALWNYEQALILDPALASKKKFAKDVEKYRETQVKYALQRIDAADKAGDLVELWNWYVRLSRVQSSSREVLGAKSNALKTRERIANDLLAKAEVADRQGQEMDAATYANQARAYGNVEAANNILGRLKRKNPLIERLTPMIVSVDDTRIRGDVRTNGSTMSVGLGTGRIPVLYGEAPSFYVKDKKQVKLKLQLHYSSRTHNALAALAQERGAELVVNVQGFYKGTKFGTTAELAHRVQITD